MPLLIAWADTPVSVSIFDPAAPPAQSIRSLSVLIFAITAFIFVVVEAILFYSLFRFRRSGTAGTAEPPQVYGSKPIEIAWTAAPALVVFVLVLVTARTLWEVKGAPAEPRPGDNTLFVTVVGRQWWWEFRYESYNGRALQFTTANELHIPAGDATTPRRVRLTLKSADVVHSFWLPRLGGKTDLIPGVTNHTWFQVKTPGLYLGQCAEYCGTQHANMLLRVAADAPQDFDRWLENEQKPAAEDAEAKSGRATFLSQSCVNCHRVRGTPANGSYAPDLTHLMSRKTLAAGIETNTAENLRQWVADPQRTKPGCLMPAFGLSDRERDEIVAYLQTLR